MIETQSEKESLFWFGYQNCKAKPTPSLKLVREFQRHPYRPPNLNEAVQLVKETA